MTEMKVGGPQIFCWAQDNRGMVYVGDMGGIIEFNGREWKRIPNNNNSLVRSMATDSLGRIYVGCSNDFGILQPNKIGKMEFCSLSKPVNDKGIKYHDIWKVFATPEGVFFCANKYIIRYLNQQLSVIPVDYLVQDTYLLNKKLYLPTKRGLCLLNDTMLVPVSPKVCFHLTPWQCDEFLTTNGDGKLHTFNLKTHDIKEFKTQLETFFNDNPLCEIERIDENKFVVATETNKIVIFSNNGEVIQFIGSESGLMKGNIYKLFVDKDKNLWVCMSKGVAKIDINYPVLKFGENNNINATTISACLFNGKRYIATTEGIYYLPPFNFEKPDENQRFIKVNASNDEFWEFMVLDNQLYAISSFGLWLINDTDAKRIYKIETPQKAHCFGTSQLFPNVIFVGMRGNLVALKLNGTKNTTSIKIIDEVNFPEVTEKIRSITCDKEGNLWLNTQFNGVYYIRFMNGDLNNRRATLLGTQNGLPNLNDTRSYKINNEVIFSTETGLLQPTFPKGINEPDSLIRFVPAMQFGDSINEPYTMIAPVSENRYLIASTGIHYATINGTKQAFDSSGFFRMNFTLESISFGNDSIISFCSADGLFNYDTKNHRNFNKPFNTNISKVEINNDSTLFGGCFYSWADSTKIADINQTSEFIPTIDYKYNSITFHFSSLFYEEPEVTEFQYQLIGYDKNWSDWSTENKANYTNLPHGKYTFRVKAKNAYWKESNFAEYQFTIKAPWYFTWWAYSIYVSLFAGTIYLAMRLYTRRLQRQKEYLELVVEERTGEIIEQARELKTINEKLVEMDKFKQGVTSMIVHDLKNPINAIMNAGDADPVSQLKRVRQTGKQMLNLVMNILDVSKYEETNIPLTIENHQLLKICRGAIEQIEFLSSEKNIIISVNIDSTAGIRADADIIERVLVNILTNAIKFTPNNGQIAVSSENDTEKWLKISIADNGIGIPPDKINLVFQKFGQVAARNSGSVRSTGLGLAFCKMAIEAHGGAIGVESKPERGSTFWLTLPTATSNFEISANMETITVENRPIELPAITKAKIEAQLTELRTTEFYKITEITAILSRITDDGNDEIHDWKRSVINAAESGNETLYKNLLQ